MGIGKLGGGGGGGPGTGVAGHYAYGNFAAAGRSGAQLQADLEDDATGVQSDRGAGGGDLLEIDFTAQAQGSHRLYLFIAEAVEIGQVELYSALLDQWTGESWTFTRRADDLILEERRYYAYESDQGIGHSGGPFRIRFPSAPEDDAIFLPPGEITQSGNTITATPHPALGLYEDGQRFIVRTETTNTGNLLINISGLGARTIRAQNGNAFAVREVPIGTVMEITYYASLGYFISDFNPAVSDWNDAGDLLTINSSGAGFSQYFSLPATTYDRGWYRVEFPISITRDSTVDGPDAFTRRILGAMTRASATLMDETEMSATENVSDIIQITGQATYIQVLTTRVADGGHDTATVTIGPLRLRKVVGPNSVGVGNFVNGDADAQRALRLEFGITDTQLAPPPAPTPAFTAEFQRSLWTRNSVRPDIAIQERDMSLAALERLAGTGPVEPAPSQPVS